MRILLILAILALPVMAFAEYTEKTECRIEVLEDGQMQIRRADIVLKDGVEISKRYHRHCLAPGADTTNETDRVKAVAEAVWTPEVIEAYQDKLKEIK